MSWYVLDTNTIGHLVRRHSAVVRRVTSMPFERFRISAITEGELRFGLANRPAAKHLHLAVAELLRRIDVLPWDSVAAKRYGTLRAALQQRGKGMGDLDLLIAAHVLSVGGKLVTADKAYLGVDELVVEDWTLP